MADDLEALGYIFRDFRDVSAELAQHTFKSGAATCLRTMRLDLARQIFGKGATGSPELPLHQFMERRRQGHFFMATRCLQLYELQFQLRDLSD
jgi:hypothetical protein